MMLKKKEKEFEVSLEKKLIVDFEKVKAEPLNKRMDLTFEIIKNLLKSAIGKSQDYTIEESLFILKEKLNINDSAYSKLKRVLMDFSFYKYSNYHKKMTDSELDSFEKDILSIVPIIIKKENEADAIKIYGVEKEKIKYLPEDNKKHQLMKNHKKDLMCSEREIVKQIEDSIKKKVQIDSRLEVNRIGLKKETDLFHKNKQILIKKITEQVNKNKGTYDFQKKTFQNTHIKSENYLKKELENSLSKSNDLSSCSFNGSNSFNKYLNLKNDNVERVIPKYKNVYFSNNASEDKSIVENTSANNLFEKIDLPVLDDINNLNISNSNNVPSFDSVYFNKSNNESQLNFDFSDYESFKNLDFDDLFFKTTGFEVCDVINYEFDIEACNKISLDLYIKYYLLNGNSLLSIEKYYSNKISKNDLNIFILKNNNYLNSIASFKKFVILQKIILFYTICLIFGKNLELETKNKIKKGFLKKDLDYVLERILNKF